MIKQSLETTAKIYFISPHLDDAIFSAGGLMSSLVKTNKVVLINIFTGQNDAKETVSSGTYLKQVGYSDRKKLFSDRISEDLEASKNLGVNKVINLGFIDALWRKKQDTVLGKYIPEFDRTYPIYRYHIIKGNVSKYDKNLINKISIELKKVITDRNVEIYCPMGFGNHVDHLVVRDACRQSFSESKITYWSDYPYINRENSLTSFYQNNIFRTTEIKVVPEIKNTACRLYKTQYIPVLKNSTTPSTETYYKLICSKFKSGSKNLLYALVHEPKNTIYNILNYNPKSISIKPFSAKDAMVAQTLLRKIKNNLPYSKPNLIGSLALKSPGQGDIDIVIGVKNKDLQKATEDLSKIFQSPTKNKQGFVQWKIIYRGRKVDMDLLDVNGERYRLQTDQVKKILSNKHYLKKYQELKYSTSSGNKFWYSIARVIYFYKLNSGKLQDGAISNLTLVRRFGVKKHVGAYTFSIYKDKSGQKIFVKKWAGIRKNLTYSWLKNEISVYKLLSNKNLSTEVITPKYVFSEETKNNLYLGLEYLKGKDLSTLSGKVKADIFIKSIRYLNNIYLQSSKKDLSKVTNRGPLYWLLILPFIVTKAILNHPTKILVILKSVLGIFIAAPIMILRGQKTLVHRDFNDYNCFLYRNKICLIDFQLTCIADPLVEYAVILLKYFDKDDLKSELLSNLSVETKSLFAKVSLQAYFKIFAIYDLSLSDGSHFLSLPAITKGVKI